MASEFLNGGGGGGGDGYYGGDGGDGADGGTVDAAASSSEVRRRVRRCRREPQDDERYYHEDDERYARPPSTRVIPVLASFLTVPEHATRFDADLVRRYVRHVTAIPTYAETEESAAQQVQALQMLECLVIGNCTVVHALMTAAVERSVPAHAQPQSVPESPPLSSAVPSS
jgi:hypothetical protein